MVMARETLWGYVLLFMLVMGVWVLWVRGVGLPGGGVD